MTPLLGKPCCWCGKAHTPRESRVRYCSPACSNAAAAAHHARARAARRKRGKDARHAKGGPPC